MRSSSSCDAYAGDARLSSCCDSAPHVDAGSGGVGSNPLGGVGSNPRGFRIHRGLVGDTDGVDTGTDGAADGVDTDTDGVDTGTDGVGV